MFDAAKICQKKIVKVKKIIEKMKIPRLFDKSQINGGLNRIGRVKSRNDNDFLHAFLRKLKLSVSR